MSIATPPPEGAVWIFLSKIEGDIASMDRNKMVEEIDFVFRQTLSHRPVVFIRDTDENYRSKFFGGSGIETIPKTPFAIIGDKIITTADELQEANTRGLVDGIVDRINENRPTGVVEYDGRSYTLDPALGASADRKIVTFKQGGIVHIVAYCLDTRDWESLPFSDFVAGVFKKELHDDTV